LDLDRLTSLLRPDTRAVVVNFPNNPTGFVPDRATFVALAQLCHERGLVLVNDEVYRDIEVDPEHLDAVALGVGQVIHDRSRGIVAQNVVLFRDFFAEHPDLFEFEAPIGGCVSFPPLPRSRGSRRVRPTSRRRGRSSDRADRLVCDNIDLARHAGELQHADETTAARAVSLSDLTRASAPARTSAGITIADLCGIGAEDATIAAAALVGIDLATTVRV